MDWETLLGLIGIYLLLLANMVYHWMTAKRLIKLNRTNNKLLESNERVLGIIGDIIVEASEEKDEYELPKEDYKLKFNLPSSW